jgi:hypothetical protein
MARAFEDGDPKMDVILVALKSLLLASNAFSRGVTRRGAITILPIRPAKNVVVEGADER